MNLLNDIGMIFGLIAMYRWIKGDPMNWIDYLALSISAITLLFR